MCELSAKRTVVHQLNKTHNSKIVIVLHPQIKEEMCWLRQVQVFCITQLSQMLLLEQQLSKRSRVIRLVVDLDTLTS